MRIKLYRGQYYAVWFERGETRRASLRTRDRATAEQRLADQLTAPIGTSVSDIVRAYIERKSGAASHEAMRYSWQALEPHFGNYRPDQITAAMCKAYAKARKVSAGTIIKDLGLLRTALKGKGGEYWFPPAPPPRDRFLTRPEFERLLAAASLPHIRLFITLALTTAARTGALLGLTWDRVDLVRGIVSLADGKPGRKGRSAVPMNKRAREALEAAYEARTCEHVIEWAGRPVKSVRRAFQEAAERSGVPCTAHVLRHTAAVWMIESGATIAEVAQYLGHSDTRTTFRVYARHSPEHQRKLAAALE